MNTTMIEHRPDGSGRARPQWRIRQLAGVVLALMATSAGVGALAQRVSTALEATPAVTVVPENGAFGSKGIDHSGTTSQCLPTRSRVVLLEFRFPTGPCTNPPVLVSDRSSARSSL